MPPSAHCLLPLTLLMYASQADAELDAMSKLWKKRATMIAADPLKQKSWTDFPAYPSTADPAVKRFCGQVSAQLVLYRGRKGEFARDWVIEAAEKMPAYEWWEQYGSSVPELQTVACMILSQPSSASIIERINSEFSFIKDRRRNRLGHACSNTLVGLFHNLRLLKRMRRLLYTEQVVGWNDEDEKSGVCSALALPLPLALFLLLTVWCCLFATGLVKYGVAHYEAAAPRKCLAITAPVRPAVAFENAAGAIVLDEIEYDMDATESPLLLSLAA